MRQPKTKIHLLAMAAACACAHQASAAFCEADLDGDGSVGAADLALLLGAWGPNPGDPADFDSSGGVDAADLAVLLGNWNKNCAAGGDITRVQLAGQSLFLYPFFEYVTAINDGDDVQVAIDPGRYPDIVGQTCDIYVVEGKTSAEWAGDPSLSDETGGAQTESFVAGTIQDNTFTISGGASLSSDAGTGLGVAYDIVCDCNQNGTLDDGDFIDGPAGEEGGADEAGMYIVHDITADGPLGSVELSSYSVGTVFGIVPTRTLQNTFYPANIASLGEVPLIQMSHGNGHDYQWYDYLGTFFASYGYVFMSHQDNTGPGIETASQTTLGHTDAILQQQGTIGGGVLDGHLDSDNIYWLGHSRGAESVARSYDRILDGSYVPTFYSADSIQLVSSIAPTDFLGPNSSNPHDANHHLLYGSADGDVCGCPSSDIAQSFLIYERATDFRHSTYVQGADHNDFNCCGFDDFTGPFGTAIGRPEAQNVTRGTYLALIKHINEGNIPARDYLTRPYESIRPLSVLSSSIVVLEYKDTAPGGNDVIDDFQTQTSTGTSSSGGSVSFTVSNLTEGLLNDNNTSFTWSAADPMNGMTRARTNDATRGIVFDYTSSANIEFEVVPAISDFSDDEFLSFRACQGTRHPQTTALLANQSFNVTLIDGGGTESTINFRAFGGGGLNEPYQRTGFGSGAGWQNEFETIRIRLTDFLNNGSGLDLSDIDAVRFDFGVSPGTAQGRIGLDDIEVTSS